MATIAAMETLEHPIREYRLKHRLTLEQFAERVGVRKSVVCKWERGSQGPSPQKTLEIERVTGGEITREELRPDVYPTGEVAA